MFKISHCDSALYCCSLYRVTFYVYKLYLSSLMYEAGHKACSHGKSDILPQGMWNRCRQAPINFLPSWKFIATRLFWQLWGVCLDIHLCLKCAGIQWVWHGGNDRNVGTAWREWGMLGMGLLRFIALILPSCLFLPTSTYVSLGVIIKTGTLAIKSKTIPFTTYLGLSWNKVASNMPDATKEQQIWPALGRHWIPWENLTLRF